MNDLIAITIPIHEWNETAQENAVKASAGVCKESLKIN